MLQPYLIWVKLGLVAILCLSSAYVGYKIEHSRFESYKVKQAKIVADLQAEQQKVTTIVETKYIKGADRVRTITKEIIKEVPVRVTDTCVLSNGFVSLHNSAAENTIPTTTNVIDAAASGITVASASGTIFNNYGTCNEIRLQLLGLQEWIKKQSEIK